MKIASLVKDSVTNLNRPSYRTIPPGVVRMNDNSNLFMTNPAVKKVAERFDFDSLSAYPSVFADELGESIAGKFGVDRCQIIIGNGSDEIIDLAVKCYIESGDKVAIPVPTFEMYSMYSIIAGAKVIDCPLIKKSFQLDVNSIIESGAKMIFISSPNNPTGNSMAREDILRLIDESNAIIVLDEAYVDFTDGSGSLETVSEAENVLILRTFSKAYALPGLRIGFGIASTELAEPMMKICAPFRLNSFSEKVALEALGDDDFVREIALVARTERRWVSEELRKLGMIVYPSETNFILFRSRIPVDELVSLLLEKKIAIRNCGNQPMLDNCARVTIGRREINEIFIEAMKKIVRDAE